jgi:phosphate starvation-inducible PhoH-like protein
MPDFNRTKEAQEMFVEKSKPKKEIKYKISLSDEQKEAKRAILDNKVTILYGAAGTSKTTVAAITALDMLHKKEVERITLVRPTIATEDIGFLPGDIDDKMKNWFMPVLENLNDVYDKVAIEKYLKEGALRFLPLQFAQGVNFKNEVAIFEEAENATEVQIRMILTRICSGAKVVFTGDMAQVQLPKYVDSGFAKLISICDKVDGMTCFELTENRRDPIVKQILEHYQ